MYILCVYIYIPDIDSYFFCSYHPKLFYRVSNRPGCGSFLVRLLRSSRRQPQALAQVMCGTIETQWLSTKGPGEKWKSVGI